MSTSGSSFTYGDFKELLQFTLADQDLGETYDDELLFHATVGAIAAIMPWCPKFAIQTITGDGINAIYSIPWNVYKVDAIQDVATGIFLSKAQIISGKARGSIANVIDWIEYPRGQLYFSSVLALDAEYRAYYQMYYSMPSDPSDESFVMETPRSALMGMCYWACAHSIVPGSVASAQIRQFNTKVDSGVPVDNVLEQSARFMRALFIDEMNRQPKLSLAVS